MVQGKDDPLEVFIDLLPDHRCYHDQLAADLDNILSSKLQGLPSKQLTPTSHSTDSNTTFAVLGKQVKRLVNQSMTTLTQWSKVLNAPDTSDVVPRQHTSSSQTSLTKLTPTPSADAKASTAGSGDRAVSDTLVKRMDVLGAPNKDGIAVSQQSTTTSTQRSRTGTGINTRARRAANLKPQSPKSGWSLSAVALGTADSGDSPNAVYNTDQPTFSHVAMLVDISFLGVCALERMESKITTGLFEIQKARSNLITKIIALGMKKRALLELGILREQLIAGAMAVWNEPGLATRSSQTPSIPNSELYTESTSSSADSLRKTYQDLFSFPFPNSIVSSLKTHHSVQTPASSSSSNLNIIQTFVLLVQALHNNAVRCWMDVRNGSLAHLLYPMMTRNDSPYDWCVCIAKSQPKLAQGSLDALFRLLFISAGKAVESNPTREGHRQAFLLRMLGMRYHAATKHLTGSKDGSVWDRIVRCGAEYEKSTRDGQTQTDIAVLVTAYKEVFEAVRELSPIDCSSLHYQTWYKHFTHFALKVNKSSIHTFIQSIDFRNQDTAMIDAMPAEGSKSPVQRSSHPTTSIMDCKSSTHDMPPITIQSTALPSPGASITSVDAVCDQLSDAVNALRIFQDFLPVWQKESLPAKDLELSLSSTRSSLLPLWNSLSALPTKALTVATLQNIARIFRSMDTLRKIGAKVLDRREQDESKWKLKHVHGSSSDATTTLIKSNQQLLVLGSIQTIIPLLSDMTEILWTSAHSCYQEWYDSDRSNRPDPLKLSCARVDAILFLSRLSSLNLILPIGQPLPKPITTYLESALRIAGRMGDQESLPWISNAFYNYGGSLFKAGHQREAIQPLELAIQSYRCFLGDNLVDSAKPEDFALAIRGTTPNPKETDPVTEGRLILASRYEVLGVCFQSLHQLEKALDSFNAGLYILPLEAFRQIDNIAIADTKTSQLPAAKLLNRRARTLLMMKQPHFESVLISAPEFRVRLTRQGLEPSLGGIVQEYEAGLLSVMGVKANQLRLRNLEQIEIFRLVLSETYPGGKLLVHPIRRARVLVRLAVLYHDQTDLALQGEAQPLVEEAIEILKERNLGRDGGLEAVRNHHLAMAYTWQGVLDRTRNVSGSLQKSKPFQIALQLWEVILSGVDCFVSWEESMLSMETIARNETEKVRMQIPDPEQLYRHLNMLADCLGMTDYRVLQVQVYRLMLRLCNGILPMSEETCADSVRTYSRMGQAYLALGYSGKAKTALDHGRAILEEMSRRSDGLTMQCEVYPIWLLAHSLYLTSVGHKSQGIVAFNQAKQFSQMYMDQAPYKSTGTSHHALGIGAISKSVEVKVQRAMVVVEASLARSQLLFFEGNLPESITDAMRALRQLNRIISTLAAAVEASQHDSTVICKRPMDNPFLVQKESTDRDNPTSNTTTESSQRRQGIELLATQRYQWSVFRLLSEVYQQLSRLHLAQGSLQETEYFVKEGQHIARLSKAAKSLNRFLLDQAHVGLLKHEWEESQQILHDLAMEDDGNIAAGAMEIQDARIHLLNGDLYFATERFDRSLRAYYRTDEILTHLMDKSVISGLEQLVIREPQTPREKRLVNLYQRRGSSYQPSQMEPSLMSSTRGSPGLEKLDCVFLSEIKATMGYRTSLIFFNCMGDRAQAKELVEKSRAEDPMTLTFAEYHLTKAKMLMLELEEAMSKHLMYAMIPEAALSIGLFQKTRAQDSVSSSIPFIQAIGQNDSEPLSLSDTYHTTPSSSPSVRVTRISRRRRSQLALQQPLVESSLGYRSGITGKVAKPSSTQQYMEILADARKHLVGAFQSSFHTYPPHVVSDICARLTYLSILESCFHVEILKGDTADIFSAEARSERQTGLWRMASRAACSLEMAKAVTQRREMHGLIKQKLHPTLPQEDQAWPKHIVSKDDKQSISPMRSQLPNGQDMPLHRHKTVTLAGLEKPRPLQLFAPPDTGRDARDFGAGDVELKNATMSRQIHQSRSEQQEYLHRELSLYPSSTLGNDRSFLEKLERIYEQDIKLMSGLDDGAVAFQRDFVDILPTSWTVVSLTMDVERGVLFVNRLRANTMPLVVRLPLNRAQLREGDGEVGLRTATMGDGEGRGESLSYAGAVEELQDIMRESQDTLAIASSAISGHVPAAGLSGATASPSTTHRHPIELTKEAKTEWWSRRQHLNDRLRILLSTMEDQWLCGLKGLIQSHNTPSSEENLLGFKRNLEWIMSQAGNSLPATPARNARMGARGRGNSRRGSVVHIEISVDLCRVILNLGDQPTSSELRDLIYFLLDAYLFKNVATPQAVATSASGSPCSTASPFIEYTEEQFNRIDSQIREALRCYWETEVAADNNGYDEGAHVILVLDKHLQMFPWESCPVLRDEAVSRVPSIWFLRDRILQQRHLYTQECHQEDETPREAEPKKSDRSIEQDDWKDLEVDGRKTFYLLNPGKDLKNTEEEFKGYVQAQPGWDGIIGRAPLDMECIQGLSKNDLYIYFGHSGGEQYIKPTQIRKLGHCAVSILLGCSSGLLRGSGEFDPTGNAMNYMLAGCPTVVANLWDVTDRDLDRFSKALFTLWGLDDMTDYREEGTLTNQSRVAEWSASRMEIALKFHMAVDMVLVHTGADF
ncbi:hypothetical protein EC991_011190 [Linnemannia zychae]|nr:hypothetical protein EC991_011190 [Linnemannia zychae]